MSDLTRHEQFLNHIAHPDEPTPAPKTRTEFLLKEIAENKGGGGLPPVTAEDNGKVATVVDGAWGAAQPSGGGAFVVGADYLTNTLDKTWQEIYDAVSSGKVAGVLMVADMGENARQAAFLPILGAIASSGNYFAVLALTSGQSGVDMVSYIASSADGYPAMQ